LRFAADFLGIQAIIVGPRTFALLPECLRYPAVGRQPLPREVPRSLISKLRV